MYNQNGFAIRCFLFCLREEQIRLSNYPSEEILEKLASCRFRWRWNYICYSRFVRHQNLLFSKQLLIPYWLYFSTEIALLPTGS